MEEGRRHPRAPIIVKVSYQSAGAMRADYAHNISRGGLFIATDETFTLGQRVEMHLSTPAARRSIPVPGFVRWQGEQGDPPMRGIGVEFELDDPAIRTRVEQMVHAVFDPIPPAITGERVNILLVDANAHACRLFREGLASMARRTFDLDDFFVVVECHDGRSALAHLRASKFSMVIVDLGTPEVNGMDLIRRVRTEISQAMPVFAVARPYPGDRHDALAAGADGFLHKPIKLKQLFNTVVAMLKLEEQAAAAQPHSEA